MIVRIPPTQPKNGINPTARQCLNKTKNRIYTSKCVCFHPNLLKKIFTAIILSYFHEKQKKFQNEDTR